MCINEFKQSKHMNLAVEKKRKHLILTQSKVSLAKKILGTRTETETIEMALDSVISEAEKNKIALKATRDFLKSGIEIKDVFGNLED
jgi:hypothetical protein